MNQDQLDSLVRTSLKLIAGVLIAHGGSQMATVINTPDAAELIVGVITAGIGIYASHKSNATTAAPPVATPSAPKPVTP